MLIKRSLKETRFVAANVVFSPMMQILVWPKIQALANHLYMSLRDCPTKQYLGFFFSCFITFMISYIKSFIESFPQALVSFPIVFLQLPREFRRFREYCHVSICAVTFDWSISNVTCP